MTNEDRKNYRPKITDYPQLQIVEVEEPRVDRTEELGDIVNRINPPDPERVPSRWRWN